MDQGMDRGKMDEFREDFALLIEAGFVAVKQLDETSSTRIFHAARAISPKSTAPLIGLGYIALNKLEIKKAVQLFKQVLDAEPENWLAQTFLGICYLLVKVKRKKGEELIREAMQKAEDPTIKNLGEISLTWVEKDLKKKEKVPFFASPDETGPKP